MQFTQAGVPLSFEITFDSPDLFVGMTVFDDSGLTPSQVGSVIAMDQVKGNSYRAKFTPSAAKSYVIHKGVYTDGTFTTLDSNYSESSEAIRAENIADLIWDALLSNHEVVASFGATIGSSSNQINSGSEITAILDDSEEFQILGG